MGHLSVQDKAFLQELQRLEQQERLGARYQHPPSTAVTFGTVVPLGGGATLPGNIPGAGMVQVPALTPYFIEPSAIESFWAFCH